MYLIWPCRLYLAVKFAVLINYIFNVPGDAIPAELAGAVSSWRINLLTGLHVTRCNEPFVLRGVSGTTSLNALINTHSSKRTI